MRFGEEERQPGDRDRRRRAGGADQPGPQAGGGRPGVVGGRPPPGPAISKEQDWQEDQGPRLGVDGQADRQAGEHWMPAEGREDRDGRER